MPFRRSLRILFRIVCSAVTGRNGKPQKGDAMISERYSRQIRFRNIGQEGQEKLLASRVGVVGMGALGCVSANELARAGIGYLRIIDRDLVELSNLQRQVLYTEADAEKSNPKVYAAAGYLESVNSEISIDPVFGDLNSSNAGELLGGLDLIIDATDNFEARYLINEYCVENGVPWVYGGAVRSEGMTASFIPGGPCLSCFTGGDGEDGQGSGITCSTAGVLNSMTAVIASIQVTEAIKILTGSEDVRRDMLFVELWDNEFINLPLEKNPVCPVCAKHQYRYLGKASGTQAVSVCGKNAYQIIPEKKLAPDLEETAARLSGLGDVNMRPYFLEFSSAEASFRLFRDGRAIISNVDSEGKARSVYSEYIGL